MRGWASAHEAGELIAWNSFHAASCTASSTRRVDETLGMQGLVAVPTYLLHQMWE